MTLVCARVEKSFGAPRITALADTRATIRRPDKSLKTVSDTTVKLFALPVRCFALDGLTPVVGAWTAPYFETTIGLGFSGHCFEALTVIAHVAQSVSALVAPNGDEPAPTAEGLVNLIARICDGYYQNHSGDGDPILLLLVFGFEDTKPWIAKITWAKNAGLAKEFTWATDDTLMTVGQDALFQQRAGELRSRIQKHREAVAHKPPHAGIGDSFERDLEVANHELAERKATEEGMLQEIESEFVEGIGGVLQRLELALIDGSVVAGFTHDDRQYVMNSASYSVTRDSLLGPVPIIEKMGRSIRKCPT